LNVHQHRMARPEPDGLGIWSLFLAGDYLAAEGAGGDLAVTSAKLCAGRVEELS